VSRFKTVSAAFNPDLTCLKITFRLVSHIPPMRDEIEESDSESSPIGLPAGSVYAVRGWPLSKYGTERWESVKPRKDYAAWGRCGDPAGDLVRHLRNGKEADEPLVCGL